MIKYSTTFKDEALGSGVYEGDLAYGRALVEEKVKGKDFPAEREGTEAKNKPLMPLKLVQQRDVALWTKDNTIKDAKKNVVNSQHYVNHIIQTYVDHANFMRANITLRVGKQRL